MPLQDLPLQPTINSRYALSLAQVATISHCQVRCHDMAPVDLVPFGNRSYSQLNWLYARAPLLSSKSQNSSGWQHIVPIKIYTCIDTSTTCWNSHRGKSLCQQWRCSTPARSLGRCPSSRLLLHLLVAIGLQDLEPGLCSLPRRLKVRVVDDPPFPFLEERHHQPRCLQGFLRERVS